MVRYRDSVITLTCFYIFVSGGGPEGEDAEHGEVPVDGDGHGSSRG